MFFLNTFGRHWNQWDTSNACIFKLRHFLKLLSLWFSGPQGTLNDISESQTTVHSGWISEQIWANWLTWFRRFGGLSNTLTTDGGSYSENVFSMVESIASFGFIWTSFSLLLLTCTGDQSAKVKEYRCNYGNRRNNFCLLRNVNTLYKYKANPYEVRVKPTVEEKP